MTGDEGSPRPRRSLSDPTGPAASYSGRTGTPAGFRRRSPKLSSSSLWNDSDTPAIHAQRAVRRSQRPTGPRGEGSARTPAAGAPRRAAGRRSGTSDGSTRPARTTGGRVGSSGRRPRGPRPPSRRGFRGHRRWRIVAIPLLALVTLLVALQWATEPATTAPGAAPDRAVTASGADVTATSPPAGAPSTTRRTESPTSSASSTGGAVPDPAIRDADGQIAASVTAAALPAGPDFVAAGTGAWHVVPGTTPMIGTGPTSLTYTIEIEDGLPADTDQEFAALVDATLADTRSWIGGGQFSLTRIDSGEPDFRISLTSQLTIRSTDLCGFQIPLESSCFNRWVGRVMINDARWVRGALTYPGDLPTYRSYAVNHEVGHALGMGHVPCPAQGALAPLMMQQSWSTSNDDLNLLDPQTIPRDGHVCVANPYPFPPPTEASNAAG